MANSDSRRKSQQGMEKFTVGRYYSKTNGSAVINLPKGFDVGLRQGEELAAKWDGSKIILVPIKKVNFE